MIKKLYISFVLLVSVVCANAQHHTNRSIQAYQLKDYKLSLLYSDTAITLDAEKNNPTLWRVRAFAYKELYKASKDLDGTDISNSIDCFIKAIELDTEKTDLASNRKSVKYLASKYWNASVAIIQEMYRTDYDRSIVYYERYKEILRKLDNDISFKLQDVEVFNGLGQVHSTMYQQNKDSLYLYEKALDYHYKAFELDTNNMSANLSIGILYYNKGVDLILSLPIDADLQKIFETQDKTIELFLKSKPFLLRAHYKDPKNREVLTGINGIMYELNDDEQIKYWKGKLDELKNLEGGN